MTCENLIKIHCDATGCCEYINVSVLSEAEKKGWTSIGDYDYCPKHSKMIDINWCPHCEKDTVVISGPSATTESCHALCTCCKMRGPSKTSIVEAAIAWNNFCERSK